MVRKGDAGKPLVLSQEYVIDSDSDGLAEADSSLPERPRVAKRSTHIKTKQKDDRAATAEQVSPAKSPESERSASGEGESIPSSSPSSGESAVQRVYGHRANAESTEKKKKTASTSYPTPVTIAARPFQPPDGFGEVRPDPVDFSAAALGSFPTDFSAKQIWHITAPSSVPIASIKELNPDAVRSGESILTHQQRDYAFSSGPNDPKHLLLPEGSSNVYKQVRTSVSKSYHLRHVRDRSQVEDTMNGQLTGEPSYFASRQPSLKAAPKQPELLRMRYKPFGTNDGPTPSAGINEDPDLGENEHQTPPPFSTPLHGSTVKKKKSKRLGPGEQNGLADKITESDESRARATKIQPSSSPGSLSRLKTPTNTNRSDNNASEATTEKKKRKRKRKKFGDEPA